MIRYIKLAAALSVFVIVGVFVYFFALLIQQNKELVLNNAALEVSLTTQKTLLAIERDASSILTDAKEKAEARAAHSDELRQAILDENDEVIGNAGGTLSAALSVLLSEPCTCSTGSAGPP